MNFVTKRQAAHPTWMGRVFLAAVFVFFLVIVLVIFAPVNPSQAATPQRAVVVELFTSEGCSSCPPADELLGHLRQDLAQQHIEVIPLGFHVDYWNSLGWKDRFSSADFSRRQEQYARKLHLDGPYTPQMVVDGEAEFVGNSASKAHSSISQAAGEAAPTQVKLELASGNLQVEAKGPAGSSGNIILAITEDNLSTNVGGGENGGRQLHHAAVVREFRQLGQLQNGSYEKTVPLHLEKDWKRDDLHVVVFVQEASSGRIQGAASASVVNQR